MAEFTETVTTTRTINCPECASEKVVKSGRQSGEQRYLCRGCNRRFRANGKAMKRRVAAEQIGAAIRMYYSGTSYKQIAEHLRDAYGISEPSKATIYEWVRDYTQAALDTMRDYPAHTGGDWVVDEMQLDVGGEKYWNWNVMDSDTSYLLASYLSKERDEEAAKTVLRKAAGASASPPKTIKTDRLRSYPPAVKAVFPEAKHIQSDGMRSETHNNKGERVQGTFRQRTKTLRGLENQASGQRYLDGWVLNYNLFREHESLGDKPPGEAAKVNAPFREWADVTRGHAAPPSEAEAGDAKSQTAIRQWASEHQESVSQYHRTADLTWKAIPVSEVMSNPAKQRVHQSRPAPASHQGSRYYIARLKDGQLAWVRVSSGWGTLPATAGKDGKGGMPERRWELEGGRRTRSGEAPKTTQAGYIPVAEDGTLKHGTGRAAPKVRQSIPEGVDVKPASPPRREGRGNRAKTPVAASAKSKSGRTPRQSGPKTPTRKAPREIRNFARQARKR